MRAVSEKIDERILRLLGLEDIFDIDYDTYLILLKEAIVVGKNKLPEDELSLLANERKRIRGKKGRFKPKKEKITASKVSTTKFIKPTKKTLALPSSIQVSQEEKTQNFSGVRKTLDSILKTLTSKFKFDQKQADQERRDKETERRGKRESTLEGFKKGVASIVATTKKMLSPFQAIIDRIFRFIFFTLLGRAFTKFMEWMGDKGNQEKFNSFIEFLSDHWPALAGLYILFGTSFGKLVRGLLKGATRMIVALAMNVGKIRKFIGKHKKLAFLGIALAPLASRELGNILGENKETPESGLIPNTNPDIDSAKKSTDQAKQTNIPKFNLGGLVPKFNFGGMLPSFAMGAMNPFGGMDFGNGVPITGAGSDNTLIAAKTGEAILTEKDQRDINQNYVNRFTGQPLNIPQYLAGRKPGSVSFGNLRFPGLSGGFSNGGLVLPKFNQGGIVGGLDSLARDTFGRVGETYGRQRGRETGIPGGGWFGEQLGRRKGERLYEKIKSPFSRFQGGGRVLPMRAENPNRKRSRFSHTKPNVTSPLSFSDTINRANQRLIDRQAKRNTIIENDATQKLSQSSYWWRRGIPGSENYKMPGYNKPKWKKLDEFRSSDPRTYKENKKQRFKYSKWQQYSRPGVDNTLALKGGGFFNIRENTGTNIPGATADRQLINLAVQPGERGYILPKGSVDSGIVPIIDLLVAMTDSDSTPFKQGAKKRIPNITPYNSSRMGGMMSMTLPPITQNAGGSKARSAGLGGGSEVPSFSAIAPNNERAINASIYGLVA